MSKKNSNFAAQTTDKHANIIYCIRLSYRALENILCEMIDVQKIWLTDTAIWIQTADGRKASEKFADYAGLRNASKQEREDYSCSPFGVHWPRLDEDLSYEGFFAH